MFKSLALFALAAVAAVSAQLTVSTPPSLVQCQPVLLSWSGGTAPYILSIIPGGQTSAAALETLEESTSSTSYTWTVNIAAGTAVTIQITDATGSRQYSSQLTIQSGGSSSCLNATATSLAGGAGVTGNSVSSVAASSTSAGSASATSSRAASSSAAGSSAAASSSAAGSSAAGASSTTSKAASSAASSAAATTSGAAFKKYEVPAAIIAVIGGVAALL